MKERKDGEEEMREWKKGRMGRRKGGVEERKDGEEESREWKKGRMGRRK